MRLQYNAVNIDVDILTFNFVNREFVAFSSIQLSAYIIENWKVFQCINSD